MKHISPPAISPFPLRAIKFIGPWIVPLLAIAAWGLVLWLPLKVVGVV